MVHQRRMGQRRLRDHTAEFRVQNKGFQRFKGNPVVFEFANTEDDPLARGDYRPFNLFWQLRFASGVAERVACEPGTLTHQVGECEHRPNRFPQREPRPIARRRLDDIDDPLQVEG
jgi:hypothetical protein